MLKQVKCSSTNCPLYGSQIVPYDGNKEARIVIVGESPGRMELIKRKPFQGDSGDLLKAICREVGLNYSKLFIANACRCQVKKDEMSAKQIKASVDSCRGKLAKVMELLKPKVVVVLGDIALKAVLKKSGITKARGSWVWSIEFNCWVLPTFHPAYILRNMGLRAILKGDMLRVQEFIKNGYKPLVQEKEASEGYQEVDSLDFLLPKPGKKRAIGLDTETQGTDWTNPNFVLISVSISDGLGKAYQCILHKECAKGVHDFSITWPRLVEGKKKTENVEVFVRRAHNFIAKVNGLRKILEATSINKFMANGNFDRHAFDHFWTSIGKTPPKLKGYMMDVQAGAHVLDENMYKMASLRDLQLAMTDVRVDYKQEFEKNFDKGDMLAVLRDHPEDFNYYSMCDADITRRVGAYIVKQLKRPENTKLLRYFTKMVMPGLSVLKVLETNGALIDAEQLPKVTETVTALVEAAQAEALALLPKKLLKAHEDKGLRLTRDDLVRDALFSPHGFKLAGIKRTKGNDAWSVDKETRILLLDQPGLGANARLFIHKYDEFSESHTMLTRYLRGFDKAIKVDGRIHSSYSLTVAVTGRASSRQPNMQNNPKRSQQANQIRRLIRARKGYKLVAIDQGQAELRFAAHLSGDPEMIRIFKGNFDIHTATAMSLGQHTKASWKTISKKEQESLRRKAKSANFGLLYKMSAPGFVRYAKKDYGLDLSVEEAEIWIRTFFSKYPRLLDYHQRMINFCRQHGYVESPLGRRRRLPEIYSKNPGLRNEAERQCVNAPIQSVSSDIVLLAANAIDKKEYDPVDVKECLFVHDELVFEIRDCSKLPDYAADIKNEMEHPPLYQKFGVKLLVPLVADVKIGDNLAEMTALEL